MLLNREERQTIERLFAITPGIDRKKLTEVFVNLGAHLVLSTVSEVPTSVAIPFLGSFSRKTVETSEGKTVSAWEFTPAGILERSCVQAQDGDPGELDRVFADSVSHLFRDRV